MSSVLLPGSLKHNLTALQQTERAIVDIQRRLATGKRVNSALDNPASFFTATSLTNRANELSVVLDSISSAFKIVEAANVSIAALTDLVYSAQSAAQSALASAGTTARETGSVNGLNAGSSFSVSSGKTITVNDGTTTATITSSGNISVQQILDGVNDAANLKVRASLTSDGRIQLEASNTNTIVVGGSISVSDLAQFGLTTGTTSAGTLNSSRSALAAQFDTIRAQIDQLAGDASFNGVNLLRGGSLKISFNENASSILAVSGVEFTSAGLGVGASANTFQTDKDINDALAGLTNALSILRTQSTIFGSSLDVVETRESFTKSIIQTLNEGADSLVLADVNAESAALLALQTRQDLTTSMLSLAAQSDQSVLRFFR